MINTYKEKVDRRLLVRQVIFLIIILVLIGIDVGNVFEGKIGLLLAIIPLAGSTFIGVLLSRMFKIFWHEEKGKVVSRLDVVGVLILALYIGVEIERDWIIGHWLSGPQVSAFGLTILTGFLGGRFVGTLLKINKVLSDDALSK